LYQTTVQHGHKQRLGDLFEDMFTQPDRGGTWTGGQKVQGLN